MGAQLREELTKLPLRIQELPVHRGYPVPWFVDYVNGEPEFRCMDGRKWRAAVNEKRCWVCGQKLGSYKIFVLGPMCGITRTTSEPPCHEECAQWSAANCPFLSRPQAVYRTANVPDEAQAPAGCPIDRNPGVALLWTTQSYSVFKSASGNAGYLIRIGDPLAMNWWAHGRRAHSRRSEDLHRDRASVPSRECQTRRQAGTESARATHHTVYGAVVTINCDYCQEPMGDDDDFANIHRECLFRCAVGSVAHVEGRCGCFVKGSTQSDPAGLTRRQAALLALVTWEVMEREVKRFAAHAEQN